MTHRVSPTHTAADFLRFMKKVARTYPGQPLHVVLDNSSTHNTDDVRAWLADNPRVHFHYTPTSASWLNQIEGFFGILTKQSLSVTDFASKQALQEHLAPRRVRPPRLEPEPDALRVDQAGISECLIASQRRCTSRQRGLPHAGLAPPEYRRVSLTGQPRPVLGSGS